jgi:amicyanin
MAMLSCLRRFFLWTIWAAFLAGCAANGGTADTNAKAADPPPVHEPNTVTIDNFSYLPQELTVAAGTTVTWVNHDDIPHTVTSRGSTRVLDSPPLDTDQRYSFTFKDPGVYAYYCTIHPHMTARVIVK